jgi:ribosomal protein L20A (L18A)
MKFMVSGSVAIPNGARKFEKEVEAKSESHAKDLVCALFGSTNGVNRKKVKIEKVAKV